MSFKIFKNVSLKRLLISAPFALVLMLLLYYIWWARFTNDENSLYTKYTSYPSQMIEWNNLESRTDEQGLPDYALAKIEKAKGLPLKRQHEVLISALSTIKYSDTIDGMTPKEFIEVNKGDCEDFAYLWYNQLKALELPATMLYVTVILPENQKERSNHAVVLTKNASGEGVVLDINSPMAATDFEEWKKQYQVILLYKGSEDGFSIY